MRKFKDKIPIVRQDSFDLDYQDYLSDTDPLLTKLYTFFREQRYTAGHTKTSYRVISHWEDMKLMPERVELGWRKFNLLELVWIKIVTRLRGFGFPIERIARVKNVIMDWSDELQTYPLLEYFLAKAWVSRLDPYVAVTSDGRAAIACSREIEGMKGSIDGDMLLISLKSILKELGFKTKSPETLIALNREEAHLISEVRDDRTAGVRARKLSGKIHKVESLEDTKVYSTTPSFGDIVAEVQARENFFGELAVKFEKGRRQSVTVSNIKGSRKF